MVFIVRNKVQVVQKDRVSQCSRKGNKGRRAEDRHLETQEDGHNGFEGIIEDE